MIVSRVRLFSKDEVRIQSRAERERERERETEGGNTRFAFRKRKSQAGRGGSVLRGWSETNMTMTLG